MTETTTKAPKPGGFMPLGGTGRVRPPPTEAEHRAAAAYHEAGHAVMGLLYGFWIDQRGVHITDDWLGFCGVSCRRTERTLEAEVAFGVAGWQAEHLHHGRGGARREGCFIDALFDVRYTANPADIFDPGDLHGIARSLLSWYPDATDECLLSRYRGHVRRTRALLRRPAVWAAVERVALALIERGRLDAEEVYALTGEDLDDHRQDF